MRLIVRGRFRNDQVSYEAGQVIDVADALGEYLMRCSPGSFTTEQVEAVSSETVSGISAPDRRARGGQSR